MLVIAGGIVLGFFAIVFILAFAEQIAKTVVGLLIIAVVLTVLGLAYAIIDSIPQAMSA